MPTDDEYRERVRRFSRNDIVRLWEQVTQGDTPGWEPGRAFEFLILRAFELDDVTIRWPYRVHLEGEEIEQIDGAVHLKTLSCLIESKDQAQPVNAETIAKLRNQLLRRPAGCVGVLFSRTGFTKPARTVARYLAPQTVLLWIGDEVEYALREKLMATGLLAKYRHALETGFPDFNLKFME